MMNANTLESIKVDEYQMFSDYNLDGPYSTHALIGQKTMFFHIIKHRKSVLLLFSAESIL